MTLLALAACSSPVREPQVLATYRTPEIPPECQQAVYNDPKVQALMIAGAGQPVLRAQDQDKLAFAQDEALRRCLREKGLMQPGGVEPVRYLWYKSPF
jgi:hypothetical protein